MPSFLPPTTRPLCPIRTPISTVHVPVWAPACLAARHSGSRPKPCKAALEEVASVSGPIPYEQLTVGMFHFKSTESCAGWHRQHLLKPSEHLFNGQHYKLKLLLFGGSRQNIFTTVIHMDLNVSVAGVPRESLSNESRVALTPEGAATLVRNGVSVYIESNAGALSNFSVRYPLSVTLENLEYTFQTIFR